MPEKFQILYYIYFRYILSLSLFKRLIMINATIHADKRLLLHDMQPQYSTEREHIRCY